MFEPLPEDLASALAADAAALGGFADVRYRTVIGSTNDAALALALSGAPEGTAVLADQQASGRGRRGRDWFSPPGTGLYLSIVVRPSLSPQVSSLVTLAAGVAVARAVRAASALPVELKWPNDLVIGRPWRKLGGLLCESASAGARVDAIVVGIGLNLRQSSYPREIAHRATAIETELGRPLDRAPIVVAVLRETRLMMDRLRAGDLEAVCADWRGFGHAGLSGARVSWLSDEGPRQGRALDIAADGALLVTVGSSIERVIAGEVVWESLTS